MPTDMYSQDVREHDTILPERIVDSACFQNSGLDVMIPFYMQEDKDFLQVVLVDSNA